MGGGHLAGLLHGMKAKNPKERWKEEEENIEAEFMYIFENKKMIKEVRKKSVRGGSEQ